MNLKQLNFYEILDALQVNATAGEDVFTIANGIKINNGKIEAIIKPEPHGIVETAKSTYVIISIGFIGLILKANKGYMDSVQVLDLTNSTPYGYLDKGFHPDPKALLTHIKYEQDKGIDMPWILETIKC